MKLKKLIGILAVAGLAAPGIASATNGYFAHGYGMKAKGMAGASTATASDSMGGANNPASMVWVGDRLDLGLDWFRPIRSAKREGGFAPFTEDSGNNDFLVPEVGYNKMLNPNMSLGVTVFGNGGMNTSYEKGNSLSSAPVCGSAPTNPLCGGGKLGVNLEQLIVAPTLAYKLNQSHSVGVSPLFGYQRFSADGLQAFSAISSAPGNLTNKGHDSASGWGVRVGWQGKFSDSVTVGAAYSSKISMNTFDRYKGLFAEKGDFDIPENYSFGAAFKATPELTVAVDYQRINYGGVAAIANSSRQTGCAPNMPFGPGAGSGCLGGSTGIGFGWKSIDVWKLGAEYKVSNVLTVRAGYNHGQNPIGSNDTTFNILAPGVVQDHYTLGMTYGLANNAEVTVAYMHAAEKSVTGPASNPYFNVGGTETIKMYQDSLGVAYGMKF